MSESCSFQRTVDLYSHVKRLAGLTRASSAHRHERAKEAASEQLLDLQRYNHFANRRATSDPRSGLQLQRVRGGERGGTKAGEQISIQIVIGAVTAGGEQRKQ